MLTRIQISAFLVLSVATWAISLWLQGISLTWEMLAPFSTVVGTVSLALLIFDTWAWKWFIFRGWLIKRPILCGTWKTTLQSDWVNPETGEVIGPIECFMIMRQTATKLDISLVTPESRSQTVSAGIEICRDGTFEISSTYRNKPRSMFRKRSEVHYGAVLLSAETATPKALSGEYWTDRKTTGNLNLVDRNPKTCLTFEEAVALFE